MRYESNYLQHHGIKGQKWGVRRFQNEDGTLTADGKERYNRDTIKTVLTEKVTPKNVRKYLAANYQQYSKSYMDEKSSNEKFVELDIKDVFKVQDEVIKTLASHNKKLDSADDEGMYIMYKHIVDNYPSDKVPTYLAMIYGSVDKNTSRRSDHSKNRISKKDRLKNNKKKLRAALLFNAISNNAYAPYFLLRNILK